MTGQIIQGIRAPSKLLGFLFLVFLLAFTIVANMSFDRLSVESDQLKVYCTENDTYIYVYHPTLYVCIAKTRSTYQPGGRISRLTYNGKQMIDVANPLFGNIQLCNSSAPSQTFYKYPSTCTVSVVGNNTEKLIVKLTTSKVTNYDGTEPLPINVTIEYTFYADISNFYTWVNLDSNITDYRLYTSTYGGSLAFSNFQNYEVYGAKNTLIGSGALRGDSTDYTFQSPHLQVHLKNDTDDECVTIFPLSLFPDYLWIRDKSGFVWVYFQLLEARTWDTTWINWGSYIRNISYGVGWAFHNKSDEPYIVTPWLLPNAVPNGIAQSYDELPQDTYNIIQPNSSASNAYQFWRWRSENPKRRIDLMLGYDMLTGSNEPSQDGVDKSWEQHGNLRLCNATPEWKNWLAQIEGTWIGYGIHAYHHDYPWQHEFSTITNTTWIDATLNQIYQDNIAIGLDNQTHFKAPGYKIQPQSLDYLVKYGIKYHHMSYNDKGLPLEDYYVNPDGQILLQGFDGWSVDSYLHASKSVEEIYDWLQTNMSEHGLLFLQGHFISPADYSNFNQVFNLLERNNDFDYFLIRELADYWLDALMPLKYTYNTTTIETNNIQDTRLTFRLIGGTIPTNGLVYSDQNVTLYAPNINTSACKFLRLSGYASLSDVTKTRNGLNFTLWAPSGTMGTTSVYCGNLGTPFKVYINDVPKTQDTNWDYDSETKILTISCEGRAIVGVVFVDDSPPKIGIPVQDPTVIEVQSEQNVKVSVNVTDYESGVKNVTLFYMLDEDTWMSLTMNNGASMNEYEAAIPKYPLGIHVKYKIVAYDNFGNVAVTDNSGEYYSYVIVPEISLPVSLLFTILITLIFAIYSRGRRVSKSIY